MSATAPDPTLAAPLPVIEHLGDVLGDATLPVVYCAGAPIFRQGEIGHCAYVVERGLVEVSVEQGGARKVVALLGPGDLLGEMASIDHGERSANADALEDTELLPIRREQMQEAIESASPLVGLLLRVSINRLRALNGSQAERKESPELPALDERLQEARERALKRLKLERALREALEAREFELHYQPIVTLPDGRLVGFEALMRWFRPGVGYVSPGEFIEPAESSGLIVPIGLWAVKQACSQINRFQRYFQRWNNSSAPLFVSINLSARQFSDTVRTDSILSAIRQSRVDPATVKLEMTEHLLVDQPKLAAASLARFKQLGCSLAVDDFGTGYSSLSYLHRFPLDTLKIDRSFVRSMRTDRGSRKVVQGIIGLAKALGMDVVAEGIETVDQRECLADLGCEYGQGFLYAPALPEDEVLALLRAPLVPTKTPQAQDDGPAQAPPSEAAA